MGRPPLTKSPRGQSRERIFQFVKQRLLAGEPPTVRDVQQAMGFSAVASARSHLDALVTAGRLVKDPGRSRGFRLPIDDPDAHLVGSSRANELVTVASVPQNNDRDSGKGRSLQMGFSAPFPTDMFVSIPVLGQVQAGSLSLAMEDASERVQVKSRYPANELFALHVAGMSMRNAGILPGDLAVIRKQPSAQENEIVVAMVEDQATIKRLTYVDGRVVLKAENPEFDNIEVSADDLSILGRLVQLQRSY